MSTKISLKSSVMMWSKGLKKMCLLIALRLRRVIMPGVKIVEERAFYQCYKLKDVECGKLETIKDWAFLCCKSLTSINLPSARIIKQESFLFCKALGEAKFGDKLERFDEGTFANCKMS